MNKDLGQHFLADQSVLDAIIERADISADDHVVEIGPGIGILTKELLEQTSDVHVIEIDRKLIPLLHMYLGLHFGKFPKLTVTNDNALDVAMPDKPYKVVANIPYHITSPLFRHVFMESKRPPASMTLLIQKEVAQRICSDKDASLLSIIVRLFGTPEYVTTVPPSAFVPPPKVDSAVIHVDCFDEPVADPDTLETVFKLTKVAFSQKRKMLRNCMKSLPGGLEALEQVGIAADKRPQTLSVQQWLHLADAFRSRSENEKNGASQ